MRLKSIKLAGFKSFVDPTTVTFPSNLSAVVGPNGCGKSNIIDAVRWVMGESSAKNLRGEAMTDVIFNGSSGRKPVGQASIELVFDNTDGTITGEFAGYSEISVRRKVTRDGQNIYYLNGNKCRRRDITDLFLGTGLGPRSYAIIEQGMISRLIEAKPEELRVYIEEAAGISRYKERRRDTENRMNRTRENLERLTDIREELERQLSRLERQSQAAEKYSEYKQQERDQKAQLQALRYAGLAEAATAKKEAITKLELSVEASVTEQVHQDAAIEKHRQAFTERSDKFNEIQGRFYAIGTDIARIEQTIQHSQERQRQYKLDLEQVLRDCREAEEHLTADRQKAEGWQAEILEIEPELDMIRDAEENSGETLMTAEEGMQAWQQDWDQFNQRAAEPRQQAEVQQSRIKYLEQVQQRALQRIEKLEAEREQLVVGDSHDDIVELDETLAEIALERESADEKIESLNESVQGLRNRLNELTESRDQKRSDLQSKRGRLASLEALQQAALEDGADAAKWLDAKGLKNSPRLAEQLQVEDGWERAVEVVLGDYLQAVCTDTSLSDLVADLSALEKGALTLLNPDGSPQAGEASGQCLASKVRGDGAATSLLAGVRAAESLDDALALRGQLKDGESVVTRDGLWLGANWLRVVKPDDGQGGVIARQAEVEHLQSAVAELEEAIESLSAQIEEARERLQLDEASRENARQNANTLGRKYGELQAEVSAKKAKAEQVLEGRARNERDIEEVKGQLASESENLVDARAELQRAIDAMESDTEERERLLNRRDALRAELDGARQRARHDKDRAHALAMQHQSVKTQLASVQQGIDRLQEQLQRLGERREVLQSSVSENEEPAVELQSELEAHLEKRVSVEQQLQESRRGVEEVEAALRESEKKRSEAEQVLAGVRSQLESARLEAQTLEVKRQNLKQQLAEDMLDIELIAAELPEDLEEPALETELEKLAARISRLGPINLAAIEEYKTESERKRYLDAQNDDLNEALETLEDAIKKIDRETRTRFKETFDQVNGGIQELFPKVFGGGHAYLELTGEDLLDTGIAIMARPPGKKNSTIHLLSGGEKALTAIALVFSIFRLNPAPFCMLDEVDAPLDDANVGRYARMVEEMSAQVQFIYITHNKIAMEMAHQLLGVTMHEPGVSRMVTVDVDEAAELAAS